MVCLRQWRSLALKRAGAGNVRVFMLEGEAGLSAGGAFESLNSAWGMALDNLFRDPGLE